MPKTSDYYAVLKVPRNASAEEIRSAYFKAARRLHPDQNTAPGDTEFFLDVQEAYEVLSDSSRRRLYDATLPPEDLSGLPVKQKILFSRPSLLSAEEPQLIYVLMEYSPPEGKDIAPAPPLNLGLILDRSTSMSGRNMDIVKNTSIQILRRLRPQDFFSVVSFSDRAEVIIPAMRNSEQGKLEARIQMIQTSGGTEIFQGLEAGYHEVRRNTDQYHVNHIILLTDGRTYGDEKQCLDLAHTCAAQGIGISGLGIGHEWNDTFLDELASRTGGSSMYVSRPEDIQRLLLEKFNHLWQAYAEDTSLNYELPQGVVLQSVFRLQPETGLLSLQSPIRPGVIPREGSLKILLEFFIRPEAPHNGTIHIFEADLHLQVSALPVPPPMVHLSLTRPVSNIMVPDPPPQEIVDAVSQVTLYRLQEQARLEVSNGEFNQASAHLQRLATHLLAHGKKQLAQTALIEAEHIIKHQAFSKEGDKRIKYGTRALLSPGEENKI